MNGEDGRSRPGMNEALWDAFTGHAAVRRGGWNPSLGPFKGRIFKLTC